MTAKQKLIRLAKKLNCRLEFAPMWDLTAPDNHIFAASECHYIVFEPEHANCPTAAELEEAYDDALRRLEMGLEECHCGDCDPEETK